MTTMRSDSGTFSGLSRTLWTTENSAVFAPMHSARVSAAVSVNALFLESIRRPTRRSFHMQTVDESARLDVRRAASADADRGRLAGPFERRLVHRFDAGAWHGERPGGGGPHAIRELVASQSQTSREREDPVVVLLDVIEIAAAPDGHPVAVS